MTFDEYVESEPRAPGVVCVREHSGLEMYLRKTNPKHRLTLGDFQLVRMISDNPGNGALREFLDDNERFYIFYIENVFDKRLQTFFVNRGYKDVSSSLGHILSPDEYPRCYLQKTLRNASSSR